MSDTLKDGIEGLRIAMNREHEAVFWSGVSYIEQEMVMAAASRAMDRASKARERLLEEIAPQLPPPRESPPVALQSAPAQPSWNDYTQSNDAFDDDPYELPKVVRGMGAR